SRAGCMRSRSESEPTRIPTSGRSAADTILRGGEADVVAEAHSGERDAADRVVGLRTRRGDVVPETGHVEDPATVRDELIAASGGPGVEDERAIGLGVLDPFDRRPA